MTTQLGVNVGAPADSDPAALQATGATWTRTVYRDNIPYRPWLLDLLRRAISNLFVGDSSPESLGEDESQWRTRMTAARDAYGDLVKCWSWGNEPDWHGIASWTMSKDRVNRLLEAARDVFPAGQYTLVSPGLVSGQPGWLEDIRLDLVDAVDVHPYSKFVSTPAELRELEYMLSAYRDWWGKPLWLGEYDSRTDNLSTYFKTFPGVERAAVFCWDSGQTAGEGITGMGIRDNPRAMAEFVEATANHPRPPVEVPTVPEDNFVVGDGMKALMAKRGDVPAADELYFHRGQVTEWSECMAASGRLYRYVFSTDTTYSFTPEAA